MNEDRTPTAIESYKSHIHSMAMGCMRAFRGSTFNSVRDSVEFKSAKELMATIANKSLKEPDGCEGYNNYYRHLLEEKQRLDALEAKTNRGITGTLLAIKGMAETYAIGDPEYHFDKIVALCTKELEDK